MNHIVITHATTKAVEQCSGGSRISGLGGATALEGVQQSVILQSFVENYMKMNDFCLEGGGEGARSWCSPWIHYCNAYTIETLTNPTNP